MNSRALFAVALAIVVLPAPAAHAAAKKGTFAGSLGVKVPRGAEADVRAINRASGVVAAARELNRAGRFSLSLAKGTYLVVGTVVTPAGRVVVKDIGVSLKAGQKRKGTKLTARKARRRPKARAAFVQERGNISPGRIAVEIPNVTGTTGDPDWDALRGGINDLMMTDILPASQDCGNAIIEVERRDELIKELEFQQSPYVDPSTRLTRNLIIGDVEVRGTIAPAANDGIRLTTTYIDKASGKEVGRHEATIPRDGVMEHLENFSKQVAEDLCKLSDVYEVTVDVSGEGRFATHSSTGAIKATLRARRSKGGKVWEATGPLSWGSVTFTTNMPECPYVDPVIPVINWAVTITDAGDGQLAVTWSRDGNDSTTASVDCPGDPDPPPIPGQPGVALLNTGPGSFTVPYAGGEQAISGVVEDGGDGFFNAGTITVKPDGIG